MLWGIRGIIYRFGEVKKIKYPIDDLLSHITNESSTNFSFQKRISGRNAEKIHIFVFINDTTTFCEANASLRTTTDNSFIEDAYSPHLSLSPTLSTLSWLYSKILIEFFMKLMHIFCHFYARRAREIIKFFALLSEWERLESALKFSHYRYFLLLLLFNSSLTWWQNVFASQLLMYFLFC